MNDRFKFRAWHKPTKKLFDVFSFTDEIVFENTLDGVGTSSTNPAKLADCVLEQCSGVKDKNGRLIYEGDIINLKDNDFEEKYVIEFDKDSACFCCVIRNRTSNKTIDWVPFADVIPLPIYADVVGNIHENPELLEVK